MYSDPEIFNFKRFTNLTHNHRNKNKIFESQNLSVAIKPMFCVH